MSTSGYNLLLPYLLSIEIDWLLEKEATVSLFSLVIVGAEDDGEEQAEEEKREAGELSLAKPGR